VFSDESNKKESNAYYEIVKGMITIVSIFSLSGYYVSLTHIIMSLRKVYNAKKKFGKIYTVSPLIFGLCCMVLSTFIFGDTGLEDNLIDGITDGSESKLLHLPVIFIILPYLFYSIYMLCKDQSLHKKKENEASKIMNLHIKYCILFILTITPACFFELLPILWKKEEWFTTYPQLSPSLAILLSCFGIGISVFRMRERNAKESLRALYKKIFNRKELEENPELEEVKFTNLSENKIKNEDINIEDRAVQDVRILNKQ